jgi:hypothetical protein
MDLPKDSDGVHRSRLAFAILLLVISSLASLAGLEVASRILFAKSYDLPFGFSIEELRHPSLSVEMQAYSPDHRNVLLLGGSVLHAVAKSNALMKTDSGRNIRFYNLADNAHTSLDSRHKYQYLVERGYRFDDVIFYHAINEVRANNVPDDLFSPTYDHYAFYRLANLIFAETGGFEALLARTTLGYRLLALSIPRLQADRMVPEHIPKPEWVAFGQHIKTVPPFRANLRAIRALAEAQGTRFIAPIFAFHLAPGYSIDAYRNNQLDYVAEVGTGVAVELWGNPKNVIKGMLAHNDVIRAEVKDYIPTYTISDDIRNFVDICHFSRAGITAFTDLIRDALERGGGARS